MDPYLPAVEQARLVLAGELSARELVAAYLDRSEAAQEQLNAYTLLDRREALLRAELVDRRVTLGEDPGPMAGVAVALKDLIDQKGLTTTCGSSLYRHLAKR